MSTVELSERLAGIEAEIRGHPGEFILILQHQELNRPRSGRYFGPDYYYTRTAERSLGILESSVASFDLGTATKVPTAKYVQRSDFGPSFMVTKAAWTLRLPLVPLSYYLDQAVTYHNDFDAEPHPCDHEIDLIIGDRAVSNFFADTDRMTDILHPERDPLWYQRAMTALGRVIGPTPQLEAAYQSEIDGLFERLWETEAGIAPIRGRLQSMQKARRTSGVLIRHGTASLIDDDDDLQVHSMRPRAELKAAQAVVAGLIDRLTELGQINHPYVQAFRLRYPAE